MKEHDEYELWIDAYSPETIPLERLAAYLAALAKLLGNEKSVHFRKLLPGSVRPVAWVEWEAVPKVAQRVERASHMDSRPANDERAAFKELNSLLMSDNAVAKLNRTEATNKARRPETVLNFPGRDTPRPARFGPFNEAATIQGQLRRIGGKDASAHALIVDAEGRSWPGECKRDLAQRMAPYLYRDVRIIGEARWERDEEAKWKLIDLRIHDFAPMADETLLDSVDKLRALRSSDWASVKDIDGAIRASRGHDDELH